MNKTTQIQGAIGWKLLYAVSIGVLLLLLALPALASMQLPQITYSQDNTPISYQVYGAGEPTLVFVHGWNGDSRYWHNQVSQFAQNYRVVVLDLAGHGHSGMTRSCYSIRAFADDVAAVVDAVGSSTNILIGHSMGGEIVGLTAHMMPEKVLGIIGVDSLENVEYSLNRQEAEAMLAPMLDNFQEESREFVSTMFRPDANPEIKTWVLDDMAAAPPAVAIQTLEGYLFEYVRGTVAKIFDGVHVPVVCVNGDMWPIDYEANRRHIGNFEAIVVPGGDHFMMLDNANAFNKALKEAIHKVMRKAADIK
nr:alpha/beta hydrolase [uncultured Desulfobulbus sp.]